jgi:uncharacterized protein YciI
MAKQYFFLRLIPPRPTFPYDMTDQEAEQMRQHAAYTKKNFDAGKVLVYGPVLAKTNAFGMAIVEVDDESEGHRMMEEDPTVRSGLNRYELTPMRVGAARGLSGG